MWYVVNPFGYYCVGFDRFGSQVSSSRYDALFFGSEEQAGAFIDALCAFFGRPSLRDYWHVEGRDE